MCGVLKSIFPLISWSWWKTQESLRQSSRFQKDRTKVRKQESFSVSPRVDRIWHCRSALLHFLQHIVWSIEAGIPIKLQAHILLTMVVCACPDTSSCHYRSLEPLVLELSKWHHPFNDLGLRQIMAFLEMVRGALHLLTIVSCHPFEGWFKETW